MNKSAKEMAESRVCGITPTVWRMEVRGMRWVAIEVAVMALGCPATEDRGDQVLFTSACTRTSRIAADFNCGAGQFDCKQAVLRPKGCSRTALSIRRSECTPERIRQIHAEVTERATVDVNSPYWRDIVDRSIHEVCQLEHEAEADRIVNELMEEARQKRLDSTP